MRTRLLKVFVPGIFVALAIGVGAQAPPHPGHPAPAESPQAAPMAGHEGMTSECHAMMAKKQEMQDKLQAMDVTLDKLVAEMNAAAGSKQVDAMEKPMAAVINELVAQRKATRAMTTEMDGAMMAHMMSHMNMQGAKGAMECPMMKTGAGSEPTAEKKGP